MAFIFDSNNRSSGSTPSPFENIHSRGCQACIASFRTIWPCVLKIYFQSIAAKLLCCYGQKSSVEETSTATDDENDQKLFESDKETSSSAGQSVKESLLSLKFLAICIYATIAQTRMNSIPGWTYSWLQERIKFKEVWATLYKVNFSLKTFYIL